MRRRYDVVVVGGGIHGVGAAQAAAAAGHSVLLLEQKEALACGTSSRSSKLIHGGLRYLESGRFSMVAESLRERSLLLRLAPDLVRMRWFYFPVYRHTRRRPWKLRAGLSMYAILGRLERDCRFESVGRDAFAGLDGLRTEGLEAVFRYRDAQTDDALLTRAVMRSAIQLGAELETSARLVAVHLDDGGCALEIDRRGEARSCRAKVLVNAAGPWAAAVLRRTSPPPWLRPVELVQGAHVLVEGRVERGIYYVEAPTDGRAVFIMPWAGRTLVGTTETPFDGDPDAVAPLPRECAYLVEVLDHYFPRFGASRPGAIVASFAGLRVLPAGPGGLFRRSREAILDVDRPVRPRVLTLWGGKLTTYRATAEKVMKRVEGSLPGRTPVADTRSLPLSAETAGE
jgi:glycerol-3-phosphate dehydrogenase